MNSVNHLSKYICVCLVITAMVWLSDFTGNAEIIFPEIAAICIGGFLAPKLVWKTDWLRMFICIMICAISGVLIVTYVPQPLWVQVSLAFVVGNMVLMLSGTTFVPMISAIALPVLIQTKSPVYIISAGIFTLVVILFRIMLEKAGEKEKEEYIPVKWKFGKSEIFRIIIAAAFAYVVIGFGWKFCVAPPLLVAFTEMVTSKDGSRKKRIKAAVLVTCCSLAGAAVRYLFIIKLGISPALGALVISIVIILLVKVVGICYPPAGAMAVLAMLIPDSAVLLYPIQVFAGIGVFAICAEIYEKVIKCRN